MEYIAAGRLIAEEIKCLIIYEIKIIMRKLNILVVCKLADHKLKEKIQPLLLATTCIDKIYVLRDTGFEDASGRVCFSTPNHLSKGAAKHIKRFFRGLRLVRREKIDAIIGILDTPHGYIGRTIGLLTHTPYIHMTIASHREFWINGKLMEQLKIAFFKHSFAITVTGNITKNYLIQKGIKAEKIYVLPNLPDERFALAEYKSNRHYDIISFSRIDANKNVGLLIKTLARLKDRFTLRVAIAGDGDKYAEVKQLAKELGVDNNIDFLGYVSGVDNKIRLLSDSKIFISCSKGEGFPVSLIEAMSCGCIPVVSNVGDTADVIVQGKNGFMFNDTEHEEEFLHCLECILTDTSLSDSLSMEAYKMRGAISVVNNGKVWESILHGIK